MLNILQGKRLRMTVLCPESAPLRIDRTYRILDSLQRILNDLRQLLVRKKRAAAKCAGDAHVGDIERVSAQVFAELEELVITESVGAPVSPRTVCAGTALDGTQRLFPLRAALDGKAFHETAAWPAHECRLEVGNHLS